jgi:hypothetical protein
VLDELNFWLVLIHVVDSSQRYHLAVVFDHIQVAREAVHLPCSEAMAATTCSDMMATTTRPDMMARRPDYLVRTAPRL